MENRRKVCPPIGEFSNVLISDAREMRSVALRNVDIMRAVCSTKGSHVAAPHNLPAKLLLRMRREDRAAALAHMDQPQVLRQVFSCICENALARVCRYNVDSLVGRNSDRTRMPSRTAAT